MVGLEDVREAHERIRDVVHRTPVLTSGTLDALLGHKVFLKCENLQKAGAFKIRGATNFLRRLGPEELKRGVVTHSSGNHAQALALASSIVGADCKVVMPENATRAKIEATKGYGGKIVNAGGDPASRDVLSREIAEHEGRVLVPPYDHEWIIAGAGTVTLELIDEVGELDMLLCPIGGGGLISGNSISAKGLCPEIEVVGGEPAGADDAYRSLRDGVLHPGCSPDTIADGLRTGLSELTFSIIRKNVDRIVTVTDDEIIEAMRFLWERMKIVVEPSGAVSLAALMKYTAGQDSPGKRVGVIISGGNMDLDAFFELLGNRK